MAESGRRYDQGRLEDLCKSQLKLEGVYRNRDATGSHFKGIRMRKSEDKADRLIEQALFAIGQRAMLGDVGSMLGQAIDNVEDVGYVGSSQISMVEKERRKEEDVASPPSFFPFSTTKENFPENPTFPATSALSTVTPNTDPTSPHIPNIEPALLLSGPTACPQCRCTSIKWGVSTGTCQQCNAVIADSSADEDDIGLMLGRESYAKAAQKRPGAER
jgi:hypothetical protein